MSTSNDNTESVSSSGKENSSKRCYIVLKRLYAFDTIENKKKMNKQYHGCNVAVVKPLIVKSQSDMNKIKPCYVSINRINWDPVIRITRI